MTEKTVDKWFSKFIRLRALINNNPMMIGRCCTCDKIITIIFDNCHWNSEGHAGHFIGAYFRSTRFDEQNVHLQCHSCNTFAEGKQFEHSLFINKLYGPGTAEKLLIKSKQLCKRNRYDFQILAEHYKTEAKKLAKEKGIKL